LGSPRRNPVRRSATILHAPGFACAPLLEFAATDRRERICETRGSTKVHGIPMRLMAKIIGAAGIVAASFVTTLWLLDDNTSTCPAGRTITLSPPFARNPPSGFSYNKVLAGIDIPGDAPEASARSKLVLCEGDTVLGPAHVIHAEIATQGRGRYSHWGNAVVFSSSDNSDPNSNGRTYVVVQPR
jgi:hypothetical protein